MEPKSLEGRAVNRQKWRALTKAGLELFDEDRSRWLSERRERGHREVQAIGSGFICPECGRLLTSTDL